MRRNVKVVDGKVKFKKTNRSSTDNLQNTHYQKFGLGEPFEICDTVSLIQTSLKYLNCVCDFHDSLVRGYYRLFDYGNKCVMFALDYDGTWVEYDHTHKQNRIDLLLEV